MKPKKQLILIILGVLVILIILLALKYMWLSSTSRPMAFTGQFYPANSEELRRTIVNYLNQAEPQKIVGEVRILIVPHAGYDYSAGVAAAAYKQLNSQTVKRVYLIGNSHRHYFSGVAADDSQAWKTPLGSVPVDRKKVKELTETTNIIKSDSADHLDDHVLEVQLPFLQVVLENDFKIVPLLFGNSSEQDYEILGETLAQQFEPGDLVVISSDMSHYPPQELARQIDQTTLDLIINQDLVGLVKHSQEALDLSRGEETILCGLEAVKSALVLAEKLQLSGQILNYRHSGETIFGDKNKVVGYGAVAFYGDNQLTVAEQAILLNIARETVNSYVKKGIVPDFRVKDQRLNAIQGAFVTLHRKSELRGCIGEIVANQPLWQVVRDMAVEAATRDQRFSSVAASELTDLDYEISVLTPPRPISDWQQINLGRDGVIVRQGQRSGVFLPQVATETGWSLEEFLNQLCVQKAGLEADCYKNNPAVEVSVFQAQVFK